MNTGYTIWCDACLDGTFSLDGSGSADADGDFLSYSWSASSDPTGPTTTIDDPDGESTTLDIDGLDTEYGVTESYTITIGLHVIDCAGGFGSAETEVIVTCTGF